MPRERVALEAQIRRPIAAMAQTLSKTVHRLSILFCLGASGRKICLPHLVNAPFHPIVFGQPW